MYRGKSRGILSDIRGFTLGEMLAVVSIITIVSAIGVPSFLAFQPGFRLNGGGREILSKLMWARAEAVEKNSTYVVTFPDNHSLQIFNDTNLNGSWDTGEWTQTIDIQTDYSDVTFSASGSNPTFNGRGTASGSTIITISNSSGTKTVTVSPTGNVKIS
jgi:prepilin-type N-terminal cleavage/methylation domain-containing protein